MKAHPEENWGELVVRLYFHLTDGVDVIRDETGVEVDNLQAARSELQATIAELRRLGDFDASDWVGWWFEVTDESGTVLIRFDLWLH